MDDNKKGLELYTGLKNVTELRLSILESSKSMVSCIESFNNIQDLRNNIVQLKQELKDDVVEINMLFTKLKKLLPKNIHDTHKEKPTPKTKKPKHIPIHHK